MTIRPAFFVTVPHAGEKIPPEAKWLETKPQEVILRDVDRFVDRLYIDALESLQIPRVVASTHRYAIDLNRREDEVDEQSVSGSPNPVGSNPRGLHWSVTTHGEKLITEPMSAELSTTLIEKYARPFHKQVEEVYASCFRRGHSAVFQLDAHSMPSRGTSMHKDPDSQRADVVVSDFHGKSAAASYRDLIIEAYERAGFRVALNWPYIGGGITQRYGDPSRGQHCIQVELNRALYMDEETKSEKTPAFKETKAKIALALEHVVRGLTSLKT